ncbi:MAG TPA: hypothetical protein VJL90_14005 [Pseudorhodoplanes sp.]|nr:hypothetical protein [Pseudorhodoplanes sp.]
MADMRSLRFIGMIYGTLTAVVALIAVTVVGGHILGKLTLDDTRNSAIEMSASRR